MTFGVLCSAYLFVNIMCLFITMLCVNDYENLKNTIGQDNSTMRLKFCFKRKEAK